jgi:hypothetical protein
MQKVVLDLAFVRWDRSLLSVRIDCKLCFFAVYPQQATRGSRKEVDLRHLAQVVSRDVFRRAIDRRRETVISEEHIDSFITELLVRG